MENDLLLPKKDKNPAIDCEKAVNTSQNETNTLDNPTGPSADQTYLELLRTNRPFRLYIISYLATELGRWFTYIASISIIEALHPSSYLRITILIILHQIPNLFISAFGGILADSRDRRNSMITLDFLGSIVALLYLLVLKLESLSLLYILTFCQESIAALYEPVRTAIVPMIVTDKESLRKANTLTGVSWSLMAAIGAAAGGFVTACLGPRGCYILDCCTYIFSALVMYQVGGSWDASEANEIDESKSHLNNFLSMWADGINYIRSSAFGPIVFIKTSGAIIWGAFDVLNVAFSEIPGDTQESSERLGIIFSYVGVGCIVGPLFCDNCLDLKKPESLQLLCIASLGIVTISCFGLSSFTSFFSICFFTAIRSFGSSILWIYSSLILQKYSADNILGRVTAVEYASAMLAEAAAAFVAGVMQDIFHVSAQQLSLYISILGCPICYWWFRFHINGRGIVSYEEEK